MFSHMYLGPQCALQAVRLRCEESCAKQRSAFILGHYSTNDSGKGRPDLAAMASDLEFEVANFIMRTFPTKECHKGVSKILMQHKQALRWPIEKEGKERKDGDMTEYVEWLTPKIKHIWDAVVFLRKYPARMGFRLKNLREDEAVFCAQLRYMYTHTVYVCIRARTPCPSRARQAILHRERMMCTLRNFAGREDCSVARAGEVPQSDGATADRDAGETCGFRGEPREQLRCAGAEQW